jgi:prephenate dehydratase
MNVAFQGVPGSFSEDAAIALLPEHPRVAVPTFDDVFNAVSSGEATRGVVPIENTLAGSVHAVYDLLGRTDVKVVGETTVRISHVLVGVPGSSIESLRRVYSHPIGLAQCEGFFRAHPHIDAVAAYNTAGAIADVVAKNAVEEGALGSRRAAEQYGGVILREGVEDHRENWTRFLLLARELEPIEGPRKTLLVFTLPHRPGALATALSSFRDMNLTKIESRPLVGRPFEYAFYADVVSDGELPSLDDVTTSLRVLGAFAVR